MGNVRSPYQCPYYATCLKKLVKHCLAKTEDKVQFICSRCRVSKDGKHWTMLQGSEHKCHKGGKNFDILMLATSLVDLKTKIVADFVDDVIRVIGWREQVNPLTEPLSKKRRGSHRRALQAKFEGPNNREVRSVVVRPKATATPLEDEKNRSPPNTWEVLSS